MSKNGRTDISEATLDSREFRESLQFDLTGFILVACCLFFFFFPLNVFACLFIYLKTISGFLSFCYNILWGYSQVVEL